MRVAKVLVSDAMLRRMFTESDEFWRISRDGLPDTAVLRLVRQIGSDQHVTAEFLYEDPSFPELPENREMWDCPEISPVVLMAP